MTEAPSYHDLFITTATIPRTSIFNLPYGLQVSCTRSDGWTLWQDQADEDAMRASLVKIAGEYEGAEKGLRLDVAGVVIVDKLTPQVAA